MTWLGKARHSDGVVEILIAAFSSLVALGAVVVSYMAHRHQVARAAALDAREERIEARERALEKQEQRIQASMIEVRTSAHRSSLHDGWVTPRLEIVNPSNQPIWDLTATYRDEALADVFGAVAPGAARSFPLPASEDGAHADLMLHRVTLFFTDAAGTRWSRDGGGGLRRGILRANEEWEWMPREDPVITESRAIQAPQDPPGSKFAPQPSPPPAASYPLGRLIRWVLGQRIRWVRWIRLGAAVMLALTAALTIWLAYRIAGP